MRKKNEKIVDASGKKTIINFYIDLLPHSQYLFVDFTIIDGNIKFEYGVFDLDSKILNGTFNLQQEVNGVIKGYTKHILSQYLK